MLSPAKSTENTYDSSLSWCVPLLNDAVGHEYTKFVHAKTSAYASLTMLHARVWTRLIENEKNSAFLARRQLFELALKEGLSVEHIEYIDSILFDGIYAVISRRPRRIGEGRDERANALYEIAITIGEFRVMLREARATPDSANSFQRILNNHLNR